MKILKYFFLSFILFISEHTFAQTTDTIKYESVAGIMKIPIQVNGEIHYFIFDTGTESTVIREDEAEKLGTANGITDTMEDTFHKITIQSKYIVKSLKIGNSNFSNLSITSFPNNTLFSCLGVEGIIGIDIISQFDWLIDFDKQYIYKIDTANILYNKLKDFIPITFYKKGLRPRIKLKTGDRVVDFLFDSGSNKNELDMKNYNKIKNVLKSYNQIVSRSGAATVDKQSEEKTFLVNTQLNKLNENKYNAVFNTITIGESRIGNEFWGRNQVFFSWKKNKLLFKQANTEQKKIFGISFKITNDTMVVQTMVLTEQITKCGIQIGDKVKTINGKSFKDYCELLTYQFSTNENILTIELENGKQITLTKENIY